MAQWYETHRGLWDHCWRVLGGDTVRCVLSTIGIAGGPESRMVVLRDVNKTAATVAIHTDNATVKTRELAQNSSASIHVWQETSQLQLRLRGTMTVLSGPSAAEFWPQIPDLSRSNYGVDPAPGSRIATSDSYTRIANKDRFAVLTLAIKDIDVVHLSDGYHRRAQFERESEWQGVWLSP